MRGVTDYTIKNLREAEDQAAKHGFSELQEARFPREELGAERTGFIHLVLRPGKRQPFAHRHHQAEEIYVVLSGSGRLKLDDEVIEIGPLDAIRIGPSVTRALEAGDDGLELLGFGPHHAGDAEVVQDFWAD
jgi:mannose-6-phosphate isomerase-like protein (cupin superfamily)